ncbi:hypothetical protein, partial [Bradyrhizobium sp.]
RGCGSGTVAIAGSLRDGPGAAWAWRWPASRDLAAAGAAAMSQLNANTASAALTIGPCATSWPAQGHLRALRRALKFTEQTKRPSLS